MKIERVVVGSLDENCYVLKINDTCLVVDPGAEYLKIKELIGECKILGILITHSHFDHIGALRHFLNKKNMKIFKKSNLEEKLYEVGDFKFKVIFNPGHSTDSVSFYFEEEEKMIVGDFVFKNTVGRCDLPGGDISVMYESIEKIKTYPSGTVLYPGHGDSTTLGDEIENNKYFK